MIWLSNSTIARLRDQLQLRGRRPSVAAASPDMSAEDFEQMNVFAEYAPLCEAMYLMMSADGRIGPEEREVLKGALRNLSSDTMRTAHMDAMLDIAGKNVADHGREARMREVVAQRSPSCSRRPSLSPTTPSPTRRTRR